MMQDFLRSLFCRSKKLPLGRELPSHPPFTPVQLLRFGVIGAQLSEAFLKREEQLAALAFHKLDELLGELSTPAPASVHTVKPVPTDKPLTYLVDTLFLQRSFDFVCQWQRVGKHSLAPTVTREVFHYVTGMQVDPATYVLSHIVPVKFADQSVGHVRVANDSNILALAGLDALGLPLVAHVHSHPGQGPPTPSETDYAYQRNLEQGRLVAIGLVFTADGYLRFYATNPDRFNVRICGKGIVEVERNVFRLSMAEGALPLAAV